MNQEERLFLEENNSRRKRQLEGKATCMEDLTTLGLGFFSYIVMVGEQKI
jgi:hypothetical protein